MIEVICPNHYNMTGEAIPMEPGLTYYRSKPSIGIAVAKRKMAMLAYEFKCLSCGTEIVIDFPVTIITKPPTK